MEIIQLKDRAKPAKVRKAQKVLEKAQMYLEGRFVGNIDQLRQEFLEAAFSIVGQIDNDPREPLCPSVFSCCENKTEASE